MTKITIIDGTVVPSPEDRAMIQAMYSRSPAPVDQHLQKVAQVGSGNFMGQYYVGYGHESIGELGDISIFLEGVTMAAAKAIQDNELYRGQECSTRYIDFTSVPFYAGDLTNTSKNYAEESKALMEGWRDLYVRALNSIEPYVREKYSPDFVLPADALTPYVNQKLYDKTIKAITFDICRGLLPIGATTSVAWSGDLRTIGAHTRSLMVHTLKEVRDVATSLYQSLIKRYPNSFKEFNPDSVDSSIRERSYYKSPSIQQHIVEMITTSETQRLLRMSSPAEFKKENLPLMNKELRYAARFIIRDNIDYASYRDLQRHRYGYMSLSCPDLKEPFPYGGWYMDSIRAADPTLAKEIQRHYIRVQSHLEVGRVPPSTGQYLMPMLTPVSVKMDWNLYQAIYVCNLRSGVTVHPTLRARVKTWANQIGGLTGYKLFTLDAREDYQSTRRGQQSIDMKETT